MKTRLNQGTLEQVHCKKENRKSFFTKGNINEEKKVWYNNIKQNLYKTITEKLCDYYRDQRPRRLGLEVN